MRKLINLLRGALRRFRQTLRKVKKYFGGRSESVTVEVPEQVVEETPNAMGEYDPEDVTPSFEENLARSPTKPPTREEVICNYIKGKISVNGLYDQPALSARDLKILESYTDSELSDLRKQENAQILAAVATRLNVYRNQITAKRQNQNVVPIVSSDLIKQRYTKLASKRDKMPAAEILPEVYEASNQAVAMHM